MMDANARRRNWPSSSYCPVVSGPQWSASSALNYHHHDPGRPFSHSSYSSGPCALIHGSSASGLTRGSQSLDSGSRAYGLHPHPQQHPASDVMSRYSSRSLDLGSTRYDSGGSSSSSSYKSMDPSSVGSYRSSNLTGYGGHSGYSSRLDGRSSYSSSTSSSSYSSGTSGLGSSGRLGHGSSYSSRSSAVDSVPLPRSSSFGRSEVLSSSTPRDQVEKGSYSSSLGRSSSIPIHTEELRSSRYSSRSSALSTNHSLDPGTDAAAERRLRLAERRRLREERGYSETSSDNSKEPSVERASSLRRDSESDSADALSAARARRLAARLQEASVAEEPTSKDSSPDVGDTGFRRSSRRLRGSSGSSEDTASGVSASADSALGTETRSSLRRRRQQEAITKDSESSVTSGRSVDGKDTDQLTQMSAEARRARRQRRLEGLEAASRQASGQHDEEADNSSSAVTSSSSRSWRQRLKEEGVGDVSTPSDRRTRLQHSQDEEQQKSTDLHKEPSSRRQDKATEEVSGQQSEARPEGPDKGAEDVASQVESRAERIARYKEERRKQLAHIATITAKAEEKEADALPSLFISAKRDKEDSPSDGAVQTAAAAPTDGHGAASSLTSRLRALRRDSEESDTAAPSAAGSVKETADVSTDVPHTSVTAHRKEPDAAKAEQDGGPEQVAVITSDTRNSSSSVSLDHSSKRETAPSARSSLPSASSGQTLSTGRSSLSESSRREKSPSAAETASSVTASSGRQPSAGSRETSPKKTSVTGSDVRPDGKAQDNQSASRKSKSPSPATSRLFAPTKSSAAKGILPGTAHSGTSSPRSSVSPRGSPAPRDKQSVGRSASDVSGIKGPPRIKPSMIPEHGTKDISTSHTMKSAAKVDAGTADQGDSRHPSRFLLSQHSDLHSTKDSRTRHKDRFSPQKESGYESHIPKLSSSSTTSSTLSTDKDSGVGSSRLSSSSFSSTRSQDKDAASSKTAASGKGSRLQRTAHVELSSSSSREGSEEKQLTIKSVGKVGQRTSLQSSVKRTTSMPSRTAAADGHTSKTTAGLATRQALRPQPRDRKSSSSSMEKELSPPAEVPGLKKPSKESAQSQASTGASTDSSGQSKTTAVSADSSKVTFPKGLVSPGLSSPSGNVALDDLLAKNAEFLSSDEEAPAGSRKERRKLRDGEESRLRRSLRRKSSRKSGSRRSPDGDSKGKDPEGMEVEAPTTPTLTLPTSATSHSAVVTEGEVLRVPLPPPQPPDAALPSGSIPSQNQKPLDTVSPASAPSADGDPSRHDGRRVAGGVRSGGREEAGGGTGSESGKEASPDSDSVFHTASSAPSSVEMPRRRLPDKSELRKSDLNKASSHPGAASNSTSSDRSRKRDEDVSDIRSRFSGGLNNDKTKSSEGAGKSTAVARHPSRGKEFSQLLHKFSSSSEASSSERSDTEGTQHRRVPSFKRPADKEVSSSSDDAQSKATRSIPLRTQSLKARPSPREGDSKEDEETKVERSGSFKSDFMKKRFSPVPQGDVPSEELSEVLSRRHKEVERQQKQLTDSELIGDKRTAQAEQFKSSTIEEVIADDEVASVLRARRKKSETLEDLDTSSVLNTVDQSLAVREPRASKELQDSLDSCPETQRVKAGELPSGDGKNRRLSTEEATQSTGNVQTSTTPSLHKGHNDTATKEPSPSSARSDPSATSSFTLSFPPDDKKNKAADSQRAPVEQDEAKPRRAQTARTDGSTQPPTSDSKLIDTATVTLEDRKERDGSVEKEPPTQSLASSASSAHPAADLKQSTDTSSSSALRRTESLKQSPSVARSESFERRKGILKRTPSLPKQEAAPLVDPQLLRIMEQRRQKELETVGEGQAAQEPATAPAPRNRALSAAEEIEENIRHMRESQQKQERAAAESAEEEAALYRSVADRIFHMQTRIEEVRHSPVTPKSRSGAATPKSSRSWSGSVTPRKQVSVDEGVAEVISEEVTSTTVTLSSKPDGIVAGTATEEEETGAQLMDRLNTLAANTAQFQERRQKFQKRHREDWRTRTQPVTLDEIQEADSLDTVSAFRAQVRRNASMNIFDQLKTQGQQKPLPTKSTEFPQHLTPEKRGRRGRHQRHKTLPVTAEELNAIPEGELVEPVPLRETLDLWKRDSRTDSGILSGSEVESLGSDSLRSLSLEMDISDNDPSRMSVSSKTSLFKSLDERARQEREKEKSASGAKRYIDRKKRERSRTQPVTDDEVQTAAEMSEEKKPAPTIKLPQPEVVNRPKSPSVSDLQEAQTEEDDQLTKLSLAEKVKLFSQKQKEEKEAAEAKAPPRTDAPVPKRRHRKLNSRFNTQPVTPEELEKASKISPLAMSLVKPPDPELLMGLKLKDQQELMMLHAEATLSQCSSRSGSRPSSQPGSRRGSFTTPENLASGSQQEEEKEGVPDAGISETGSEKAGTTLTTTHKQTVSSSHSELTRTDSEPRGILKKTKSVESVPTNHATTTTTTTSPAPVPPSETTSTTPAEAAKPASPPPPESRSEEQEGDRASPVPDLVLPSAAEAEAEESASRGMFFLADEDMGGESSTDHQGFLTADLSSEDSEGQRARSPDGNRRRDRKGQADRYLTQPAQLITPERSPQSKRKYEGRHMTQPITPDEMKEAEFSTTPVTKVSGGSIADRLSAPSDELNQLKTSGEEEWKKRVVKDKELSTPVLDIKKREKGGLAAVRPVSISDRLSKLEVSAEQWKERVEDSDAVKFTVANKLQKSFIGSESPLVAKIKASSKKDLTRLDDSSNASSPVNSPSTPTKEFLPRVPLPKEIVADPDASVKKAETKEKQKTEATQGKQADGGKEEEAERIRVEVPTVDDEEIEQFFSTKEITEITDKVDVEIDDFDNIFIESNEILQSVKKIRPTRKKKATGRNPLKTVSQFVEIQTEYIQVSSGAAEKHLRSMKTEAFKKDAGFAVEALAGLASKENFSKVELRKTEPSSLPASLAARRNPFSDLMLLHIKGRRNTQTRLVEPCSKSMNAGDCYILVTPDKVINWVGEFSNIIEKAKSAEVANFIQQKRDLGYKCTAPVQTVDQAKDHLGAGKHFWGALQGDKECQACGPEEEDELYESSIIKTNMVYRLEEGALQPYEKYWGAIPKHSMLDKKEVLVFDFGSEFYVWQGKEVSSSQRKQGMALAQKLWDKGYDYSQCAVNPMAPLRSEEDGGVPMQASQRPDWAIFGKVNQNMETILFREKFSDWPDTSRLIGVKREKVAELKSEFVDIKAYDAQKMIPVNTSPVTLLLEGAHVGRGKKWQEDMQGFIKEQDILTLGIKVWHVMEYEHYQMPEPSYGHFHDGDTYVVRWQYMITNAGLKSLKGQAARHSLTGRERCAYFFWQGQDSTINEKGASALMTVELDEERGPQVRVVQGKEPPCFFNLFEGGMVVHIGKREDASTNTAGPWRLYCLRGDEEGELCLLEIPVSIANLRSRSSLVLLNTRTGITYVWHGVKSPQHHRKLAVRAVKTLKENRPLEFDLHKDAHIVITEVEEGEEKAEIWTALDSKDRSLYQSLLKDGARYDNTPRLFHMTSVSMVFEVTEQLNPARLPEVTTPFPFFQSDLYKASQPALFLLDVGRCVYLWQGWWPMGDEEVENVQTGSATARYNVDRRCAMETTLNYCKERSKAGRTPEAYLVYAGVEPLAFQNLFPFWEQDSSVHSQAVQEGRAEGYCERVEDVYIKLTQTRYTLEELQERPLPDGVDPLKLESYLADEEFEEVLDMKRADFYALPSWKQNQLKQAVGLF